LAAVFSLLPGHPVSAGDGPITWWIEAEALPGGWERQKKEGASGGSRAYGNSTCAALVGVVSMPRTARYHVWVRFYDVIPGGRQFRVTVNGRASRTLAGRGLGDKAVWHNLGEFRTDLLVIEAQGVLPWPQDAFIDCFAISSDPAFRPLEAVPESGTFVPPEQRREDMPEVLFVHGVHSYGRVHTRDEFDADFDALGWRVTKVDVDHLRQAMADLTPYDLVLFSSVVLRKHFVMMNDYGVPLREYLEAGGCLIVPDLQEVADYGWLPHIGPEMAVTGAVCIDGLCARTVDGPLTHVPHDLAAAYNPDPHFICRRPSPRYPEYEWHHLVLPDKAWQPWQFCREGEPLTASRRVGRGEVIATTQFKGLGLGRAFLENVWTRRTWSRAGLSLRGLTMEPVLAGRTPVTLEVADVAGRPRQLRVRWVWADARGVTGPREEQATIPAAASREMTWDLPTTSSGPGLLWMEARTRDRAVWRYQRRLDVPPRLHVDANWQRFAFQGDEWLTGRVWGAELEPAAKAVRVQVAREEAKGKVLHQEETATKGAFRLRFPASKLETGKYLATVALIGQGGDVLASQELAVERLPDRPRSRVELDEAGNLVANGQRVFPFGFYGVHWKPGDEKTMPLLADNGFNLTWGGLRPEFLEAARPRGIYVTSRQYAWSPEQARPDVSRWRREPMHLVNLLLEEPGNCPFKAKRIAEMHAIAKEMDPDHPTLVMVNNAKAFPSCGLMGDIMMCDPYCFNRSSPATRVASDIELLRTLDGGRKPIWVCLQAHKFVVGKWTYHTVPTPVQLRCETYLALAHDVKGIIYFILDNPRGNKTISSIRDQEGELDPRLWPELCRLAREIRVLEPALFAPRLAAEQAVISPRGQLHWLLKEVDQQRYLFVVNPLSTPTEGTLCPPLAQRGRDAVLEVMFKGRSVPLREGQAQDTFPGYAARVYRY